jgi:hypothetical protein
VRSGPGAAHLPIMTTIVRAVPLTSLKRNLVADYCGVPAERIVAVHEGVMEYRPRFIDVDSTTGARTVVPDGEPYPVVEVVTRRRSGAVCAQRYRFDDAAAFFAAVLKAVASTTEPGTKSA